MSTAPTTLRVQVTGANNLSIADDPDDGVDAYLRLEFREAAFESQRREDPNPRWTKQFRFDLTERPLAAAEILTITIMQHRTFKDDVIGVCRVGMGPLLDQTATRGEKTLKMKKVTLVNEDGNELESNISYLLTIDALYSKSTSESSSAKTAKTAAPEAPTRPRVSTKDDEIDSNAADEAVDQIKHSFGDNPVDFHVVVRVIRGRHLQGNDPSPICKVKIADKRKRTHAVQCSNNPFFNERIEFRICMVANDFFSEFVELEVFDSGEDRAFAKLGHFKTDLGFIYEHDKHLLANKWLLLSNEDYLGIGYLKVSISVAGPFDQLPDMPAENALLDDVEMNVLRSSGVSLCPAVITISVFKAEDLPQMDSDFVAKLSFWKDDSDSKKIRVDPKFTVSFAGREATTKVINSDPTPEWYEQLKIQCEFPPVANRLYLKLIDHDDITAGDLIATEFLEFEEITASGKCLPTFGPCYKNFFGAEREYKSTGNDDEVHTKMALGTILGCAYRGRVLIQISTKIGERLTELQLKSNQPIHPDAIKKVQPMLSRKKYKLHTVFHNATLMKEKKSKIQFEVSIGTYGNFFNKDIPANSSITQDYDNFYDGNCYYHLPWDEEKPVCIVDSYWEDIAFRLEAMNALTKFKDFFHSNLEMIDVFILKEDTRLRSFILSILRDFKNRCIKLLSLLTHLKQSAKYLTELDEKLFEFRYSQIQIIQEDAIKLAQSKENEMTLVEALKEIGIRTNDLCMEAQNCVPFVMIWMLVDDERKAFKRLPAYECFYSSSTENCGTKCGKILTLDLINLEMSKDNLRNEAVVQIRISIWFGLEKELEKYLDTQVNKMSISVEVFENQRWYPTGWQEPIQHPAYSDAYCSFETPKESFNTPVGWEWDSDWSITSSDILASRMKSNISTETHVLFENEVRKKGGNWKPDPDDPWTDSNGDAMTKEESPPKGWKWAGEWEVNTLLACDESAWQYCERKSLNPNWAPTERVYHTKRRKQWTRAREWVDVSNQEEDDEDDQQYWEYAASFQFNAKFHKKKRILDSVRRRKWSRKMVKVDQNAEDPVFKIKVDEDDEEEDIKIIIPKIHLQMQECHRYQLRVYLYKARDVMTKDTDSYSDAFCQVAFLDNSKTSEIIENTPNPIWDQTLMFNDLIIQGTAVKTKLSPPTISIELYDHDTVGGDDLIVRVLNHPQVKITSEEAEVRPNLTWVNFASMKKGKILMASELILEESFEMPMLPPYKPGTELFMVPPSVKPVTQKMSIEIFCVGMRNLGNYQLLPISSPSLDFDISGNLSSTGVIENVKKMPNFENTVIRFNLDLPKAPEFCPPINIVLRDNREFGRRPKVGFSTVELKPFLVPHPTEAQGGGLVISQVVYQDSWNDSAFEKQTLTDEIDNIDWWSNYYYAKGIMEKINFPKFGYLSLTFYENELEKNFPSNFGDFSQDFELKEYTNEGDDSDIETIGTFKGAIKAYPMIESSEQLYFQNDAVLAAGECMIRVYIIDAEDLAPKDSNGKADPYIKIDIGSQKFDSQNNYVPNTLNPIFGLMYETVIDIPKEKDLTISVFDFDKMGIDDFIGSTSIDLEQRLTTKYRATCGLPKQYLIEGKFKWRDSKTPGEILEETCAKRSWPPPQYVNEDALQIGDGTFSIDSFESPNMSKHPHLGPTKQRLALHVLNAIGLVPNHVETRSLSNDTFREQGKLRMWVDIFPKSLGPPAPPVNISPRQSVKQFLRLVVYNAIDVELDDESITGEKMSDIYVKAFLDGYEDDEQSTDVHYRSLDGEGNFNWRMEFPFDFLTSEYKMQLKKKDHFWSLDATETKVDPYLNIQIWDNDTFSKDDALASVRLDLSKFLKPKASAGKCTLESILGSDEKSLESMASIDLFRAKRTKGFFPLIPHQYDGINKPASFPKLELELQMLSETEAEQLPVGLGQQEPNRFPHLDAPKRPETSFNWMTSPFKTLKFILWKKYKWWIIGLLIAVLLIIFIVLLLYNLPMVIDRKIFGV